MTKRYRAKLDTWVEGQNYRAGQPILNIKLDDETAAALVKTGNIEEIEAGPEGATEFADVAPSEAVMSQTHGVKPVDSKGKAVETDNQVPTDPRDTLTSAGSQKTK